MSRIEEITGKKEGEIVVLHPSLTIITNGFGHEVTELLSEVKEPKKTVVVYDHNVPAGLPEEAKVFGEILRMSQKYGIEFRQAKGIAQKWLMEEGRVKAGDIVLGGTRHNSIFGAVGAMGLGLSHTELARVMESGEYQMVVPATVRVEVTGKLPDSVGIIDAALAFLENEGDLSGKAVEFIGKDLTSHEREVLCEMATDTGAVTAFMVDDGEVDQVFDLSSITRMLRMPCKGLLDQTKAGFMKETDLPEGKIHAGQIGGMNGGDIEDLRKVAKMMEGQKLKLGFRLNINPASSQIYLKALEEGLIHTFIDYGAQINAAGDHDIVPQGAGAMGHGETLLTTGLYTYSGAMGCEDVKIYTASIETIMRASYAG